MIYVSLDVPAKAGATFYSLIETCKTNNIEPYKYFCKMLHQIRGCLAKDDYHKLLPHHRPLDNLQGKMCFVERLQ